MTRSLIFSMIETRLDIAFAMSVVSCFAKNPSQQHIKVVKTIMKYFKIIKILGIIYRREERGDLIIKCYSNLDCVGDNTIRKSILRSIFILNGGLVSWCFKKQATITLSLIEVKYMALTFTAKEAIWIRLLLTEVRLLDRKGQYTEIKIAEGSKRVE